MVEKKWAVIPTPPSWVNDKTYTEQMIPVCQIWLEV